MFWLFLSIQVVQVTKELVEAMIRWKMLIQITEVVLAILGGHVAMVLQEARNRRIFFRDALFRAWQTNLQQTGSKRTLPGKKSCTPSGTALLSVPIGKHCAIGGDAIDVGGSVAHHAAIVRAGIEPADIVTPDYQDVRLVLSHARRCIK